MHLKIYLGKVNVFYNRNSSQFVLVSACIWGGALNNYLTTCT